jgi:hypothetical protein
MRVFYIIIILLFVSCHSLSDKQKKEKDLTGNWLVLYPRRDMSSSDGRQLYARIEDSLKALNGLKLVNFSKDGNFAQFDSLLSNGKWMFTEAGELAIADGGKGFGHFRAVYHAYDKKVLQLKEKISVHGEPLTVVWHLKKIDDEKAESALFGEKANKWREQPKQIESDTEIKDRVAAMLRYYSAYYDLLAHHSNYFIPQRVLIPFKFYQRGMGLPKFDSSGQFTRFFYSVRQAKQAHHYLDMSMSILGSSYPHADNFAEGYSMFMSMMADEIDKR